MNRDILAAFAAGLALLAATQDGARAAPTYNWSGFYIGVAAGGGWADVDVTPGSLSPPGTAGSSFDASGGFGGALAGYNWQNGNFVFGLEGDVSFGSISGDNESGVPDIDVTLMASIRARAGVVFDNVLVFATAGYGLASAEAQEDHGTGWRGSTETHDGAVVGAGIEVALTDRMSGRLEYQHGFFDEKRHSFPDTVQHTHGIEFDTDTVRVGIVWSFD